MNFFQSNKKIFKSIKKLSKDAEKNLIADIIESIESQYNSRPPIKESGGARKLRVGVNKGKSGGLRVQVYAIENEGSINYFILNIYEKKDKGDLTSKETKNVRCLIKNNKLLKMTTDGSLVMLYSTSMPRHLFY